MTYRELVDDVRDCIRAHVPPGAVVLVASKGDEELVRIEGYRAWHFPRDEWGAYAGHYPASSVEAIIHLRHLYSQGARFLVFPATAAWWLDHYCELANLLNSSHRVTASVDGVCVIYELCKSAAFDAYLSMDDNEEASTFDVRMPDQTTPLTRLTHTERRRPLRVLTILARFGSEQYPHAEQEIADLFARQMQGVEHRMIVVDNAQPRDFRGERDGSLLIGGDNSSWEFSAFDRALDFASADIWSYDLVHFATSAFNALYVAYLERFDPTLLQAIADRAAALGHIDCYNEPVEVRGYHAQHWVRSCFFVLAPAEAKALGSFVSVADGTPFFSGNPRAPFRADAPISARYREYITQWLTGDGVGQGVSWHSTFALTRETLPVFEQKARAILNEHLLSIRLQALGCHLVDVTWLATMLSRHNAAEVPLSTSWREQLANRDRDAMVLTEAPAERIEAAV